MKQVLKVSDLKQTDVKPADPILFTHALDSRGWTEISVPREWYHQHDKIVHLGEDSLQGHMFTAFCNGRVLIYKRYLGDGTY